MTSTNYTVLYTNQPIGAYINQWNLDNLPTNSRGLHICHINAQSAKSNFARLKLYIQESKFDVFSVSETWFTDKDTLVCSEIQGYNILRNDRSWGTTGNTGDVKRGGGVCTYIKDDLNVIDTEVKLYNKSNNNIEIQWLELHLLHQRRIVLGTVYRPPNGNVQEFSEYLIEVINALDRGKRQDVFLLGDFNINYLDKTSMAMKHLKNFENLTQMKQLINKPTRKESILDLIYSNSDCVMKADVIDFHLADHLGVFLTRKKDKSPKITVSFEGRSYVNYDRETFVDSLAGHNWDEFYDSEDPEFCYGIILKRIIKQLDDICPISPKTIKTTGDPWISKDLLQLFYDKERFLRKKHKANDQTSRDEFKNAKKACKKALNTAHYDYLQCNDTTKFWKRASHLFASKKKETLYLINKSDNKEIPTDQTCEFINEYFSNIGTNLARNLNAPWEFTGKETNLQIDDLIITPKEVTRVTNNIDIHKSSGIDNISSQVWKDVFSGLPAQTLHMFQKSINSHKFPISWKIATVIPLQKSGDKSDVNNLRPVSLLPLPGKMMESLVHNHLYSFLEDNKLLSEKQGGFRKAHSTIDTVSDFTDDIFLGINEGLKTVAIFIDLRKAFDTVNHHILTSKLPYIGLAPFKLWIQDYLSDRVQCTLANNTLSSQTSVVCGVPQGSILGPLLFLIYINDMEEITKELKVRLYADDTVIYLTHRDVQVATSVVQKALTDVYEWCCSNKLTINIKKTKVMLFSTSQGIKRTNLKEILLEGIIIEEVSHYNYLGIALDNRLTFDLHCKNMYKNAQHKVYILSKIRKFLNTDQSLIIYRSKVLPYMDYGDILIHDTNTALLNKLQRLQNRALKIVFKLPARTSTSDLHWKAKVPFLHYRRIAHIRNFMYKRTHSDTFQHLATNIRTNTRLMDAPACKVFKVNLNTFKRSVLHKGAREWNQLPIQERDAVSYDAFKNRQKKWLLDSLLPCAIDAT